MPANAAWENESRDEVGRWTTGGGGTTADGDADRLKDKLQAQAAPLLQGMRAGAHNGFLVQSAAVASPHVDRMAKLLSTWSQAGEDWSDRAFRDHFFSPLHKQEFAADIRHDAHRLRTADNATDQRSAASDLGWRIGQYGPGNWVKDLPALQARADAALDPKAESLGLQGCGNAKHATHFEYEGSKAALCGRKAAPAFDHNAIGPDGKLVSTKVADRPLPKTKTPEPKTPETNTPLAERLAETAREGAAEVEKVASAAGDAAASAWEHFRRAKTIDPVQRNPVTDKPPEQVRADIARIASGYDGSKNWLYSMDGKESYKCNKFVADVLREAGIPVDGQHFTYTGRAAPTAGDWGDPDKKIPGWEVIDIKDAKPGDVIAEDHWWNPDASGHVGIIVGDRQTASSSAIFDGADKGKITIGKFGFPSNDPSAFTLLKPAPVVRRYVGFGPRG
jgi:hypothetical protein